MRGIAADAAVEVVLAVAADKAVVAAEGMQEVVAGVADEGAAEGPAAKGIVAPAAVERNGLGDSPSGSDSDGNGIVSVADIYRDALHKL